jgi:hypothetical protein
MSTTAPFGTHISAIGYSLWKMKLRTSSHGKTRNLFGICETRKITCVVLPFLLESISLQSHDVEHYTFLGTEPSAHGSSLV